MPLPLLARVVDSVESLLVVQVSEKLCQFDLLIVAVVPTTGLAGRQKVEILPVLGCGPPSAPSATQVDGPVRVGTGPVTQCRVTLGGSGSVRDSKSAKNESSEKGPATTNAAIAQYVLEKMQLGVIVVDPGRSVGNVRFDDEGVGPIGVTLECVLGIEILEGSATPPRNLVWFFPIDHVTELPGGQGGKGRIQFSLEVGAFVVVVAPNGIDELIGWILVRIGFDNVPLLDGSRVHQGNGDRQSVQDGVVFVVLDAVALA
mmetsp:Transcript_12491/g.35473  ORF Transcript_12491/g.35473 Transcript_12491/m.35473 type:complete len:259 (-) Transcript_12491:795-1571(-)